MRNAVRCRAVMLIVAGPCGCGGAGPLKWYEEERYRWAELPIPRSGRDGFELLPASRTGVTLENSLTDKQAMLNEHVYNGSGVALGDVDGDGLPDIYFSRLDGPNDLYRNLGGSRFEDITDGAGR